MTENLTRVDQKLVEEIDKSIKFAGEHGKLTPQEMAVVSNLRRGGAPVIGKSIGYQQNTFVADFLLPSVQASPDGGEIGYFPVWGKEFFQPPTDDRVSIGGGTKTYDLDVTWSSADLEVHAAQVVADPREIRIAAANGLDLAAQKFDLARNKVSLGRENTLATILTTGGNFGGTSALTSGGTGTRWDNYAMNGSTWYSDPIADVANAVETVRQAIGKRANTLFMGPNVLKALRFHPRIAAFASGGATRQNMAVPLGLDSLTAIFGLNIIVGEAVKTATVGGSFSDVWGKNAGVIYVGESGFADPSFGFTLTSGSYPKTLQERDINYGAEGGTVYRYIDCYKGKVTLAAAGYLYTTVTT